MACGGSTRRTRRSSRGARGLALVEYALVLSLLVIASLGVINTLEDDTGDELDNQADCISSRPPPPSCQLEPLAPTTVPSGGGGGDDGGGGSGTPEQATLGPAPTVTTSPGVTDYDVEAVLTVTDDAGDPIAGEVISIRVEVTQSLLPSRVGSFFFVDCVTDDAGVCTASFDSRWPDVTEVSFDVISIGIDTPYEFTGYEPDIIVPRPLLP